MAKNTTWIMCTNISASIKDVEITWGGIHSLRILWRKINASTRRKVTAVSTALCKSTRSSSVASLVIRSLNSSRASASSFLSS